MVRLTGWIGKAMLVASLAITIGRCGRSVDARVNGSSDRGSSSREPRSNGDLLPSRYSTNATIETEPTGADPEPTRATKNPAQLRAEIPAAAQGHSDYWFALGTLQTHRGQHRAALSSFCQHVLLDATDAAAYAAWGRSLGIEAKTNETSGGQN